MSEITDWDELRETPSKFIDEICGIEPFDYQKEFIDADARHRVVASGRQVGKSRMCSWIALHEAVTNAFTQVLITAPSLRQSSMLFSTLTSEIEQSGLADEEWGIERDTQTIIEFDNGSSIHCLPTGRNGNKIRGFSADMIIVDEAAFIEDNIYEDILEPMIFATTGRLVLASTPWGKSGYYYRKFAGSEHNQEWDSLQVSSYVNPLIEESDLEEYKEGKTDSQIKREVMGEFVEDSAQFFPTSIIRPCMPGAKPKQEGDYASLGVDIAGEGDDRTVFYGVDGKGNVFLHDEVYEDMGVLEAAEYIKTLDRAYNFNKIQVDRTAIGQGTIEALAKDPKINRKYEGVYFTQQTKQTIYQRLKAALEDDALHLPQDETLRTELERIGYEKQQSGRLKLFPRGSNEKDDHVDSLALAVWGMPDFGQDAHKGRGAKTSVSGSVQPKVDRNRRPKRQTRHRNSSQLANNTRRSVGEPNSTRRRR